MLRCAGTPEQTAEQKAKIKAMGGAAAYKDGLGNFFLGQYASAEGIDLHVSAGKGEPRTTLPRPLSQKPTRARNAGPC